MHNPQNQPILPCPACWESVGAHWPFAKSIHRGTDMLRMWAQPYQPTCVLFFPSALMERNISPSPVAAAVQPGISKRVCRCLHALVPTQPTGGNACEQWKRQTMGGRWRSCPWYALAGMDVSLCLSRQGRAGQAAYLGVKVPRPRPHGVAVGSTQAPQTQRPQTWCRQKEREREREVQTVVTLANSACPVAAAASSSSSSSSSIPPSSLESFLPPPLLCTLPMLHSLIIVFFHSETRQFYHPNLHHLSLSSYYLLFDRFVYLLSQ